MKDKFIPGFLIFTLWAFILTIWLKPQVVVAHGDGLSKRDVKRIIENCSGTGYTDGEDYVYSISLSC